MVFINLRERAGVNLSWVIITTWEEIVVEMKGLPPDARDNKVIESRL
jgi:hypothetical protein